jgi:hypothetical protein
MPPRGGEARIAQGPRVDGWPRMNHKVLPLHAYLPCLETPSTYLPGSGTSPRRQSISALKSGKQSPHRKASSSRGAHRADRKPQEAQTCGWGQKDIRPVPGRQVTRGRPCPPCPWAAGRTRGCGEENAPSREQRTQEGQRKGGDPNPNPNLVRARSHGMSRGLTDHAFTVWPLAGASKPLPLPVGSIRGSAAPHEDDLGTERTVGGSTGGIRLPCVSGLCPPLEPGSCQGGGRRHSG